VVAPHDGVQRRAGAEIDGVAGGVDDAGVGAAGEED